ncbi:MAG: DUF4342 domain-containing protein [Anaerovoracaceae bacterium]|jgi:gas vesicle protein
MEVTLEKIELVKDRTGVSYKEAKAALEAADGSVVDAIIDIEETIDAGRGTGARENGTALVDALKELLHKGNVSRLQVKNRKDEILLNVPVNLGIIGSVISPVLAISGFAAAVGFQCTVEVVKQDGSTVDLSGRAAEFAGKARDKGAEFAGKARDKGAEFAGKARDKGTEFADKARDRGSEFADQARDKGVEFAAAARDRAGDMRDRTADTFNDVRNRAQDAFDDARYKAQDAFEDAKDKAQDAFTDAKDRAQDAFSSTGEKVRSTFGTAPAGETE